MISLIFVQTETSLVIEEIADNLAPLNLSIDAFDHLLRYDVFPILKGNAFDYQGIFCAFEMDPIWAEIDERRAKEAGMFEAGYETLMWTTIGRFFTEDWNTIKEKVLSKRKDRKMRESG